MHLKMKSLKKISESFSYYSLLFLISLSLLLYPNCSSSRIERISEPPAKFSPRQSSDDLPFLKLHMKNGNLYVLENWFIFSDSAKVSGSGKLYNLNRDIISEGKFNVSTNDVAIAETNQINGPAATGVLAALTVITGIFTIVCIANPKACFGSCPTFYAFNGEDYIVQSEGFSSSISPVLEENDVDALYRIKSLSKDFTIQLKNEAYETHIIRSANLLALLKPENGRVFATPNNDFYQAVNITEAISVIAEEGDISEKVCTFDGNERFSVADSFNLAQKETIELTFNNMPGDTLGIVIASRQSLLTTFLFYQSLSFMGTTTVDWLANIERSSNQFKPLLKNLNAELGNIEVLVENGNNEWIEIGEVGETGPIATDIKIIPFENIFNESSTDSPIKVRLRMAKGLWRIDYAALAEIKEKVTPLVISPYSCSPQISFNGDVIQLLNNPDSVLITYPGDEYLLNYSLPEDFNNYELFIEPQGYYLEWIRNEWLAEENSDKVYQMFFDPKQYYKDLAPQFKKVEAEMEETFWSSKYVYP